MSDKGNLSPSLGVFHPIWVFRRDKRAGAQPAYGVFHPLQLKMEFSETDFFFDILTIHNHQISDVKHVLDPFLVFYVWANTTIGEEVKWRPPLLYPDPLGHRVPAPTCISSLLMLPSRLSPLFEVPCRRQ